MPGHAQDFFLLAVSNCAHIAAFGAAFLGDEPALGTESEEGYSEDEEMYDEEEDSEIDDEMEELMEELMDETEDMVAQLEED